MKTINKYRFSYLLSLLCATCILFGNCTKETTTKCPNEVNIDVRVVDVEGEDITDKDVIRDLSLYVFDHNKLFIKQLNTHIGESLQIYFPDQDILNVVTWGNLSEDNMQLPSLSVGTPMHEAMIRLKDDPLPQRGVKASTTRGIAIPPDDLFYSYDEISLKTGAQTSYKLQMHRSVAAMNITMRNLQSYANRYDTNYTLLVRETHNAIDFYGRLTGDKVGYMPQTSFNDDKEMIAPLFNLLPSDAEGVIEIDIYHDQELITTVKNDNNLQPLKALQGKVLNVLVDFRMNVSVTVSVTPWGITEVPKEF